VSLDASPGERRNVLERTAMPTLTLAAIDRALQGAHAPPMVATRSHGLPRRCLQKQRKAVRSSLLF
jgi:hypothetical protein